jgi:hypothetical protein
MRCVTNFCLLIVFLVAGCKPAHVLTYWHFIPANTMRLTSVLYKRLTTGSFSRQPYHNFKYDTTRNWSDLTEMNLRDVDVILFLDSRPDDSVQRIVFQNYMEAGGSWMGFHFAGFALTPSAYPQNWDWYHNEFLGCRSIRQQHLAAHLCNS